MISAPADNLYKFITIFCLLFAISLGLAIYQVDVSGRESARYYNEKIYAILLLEDKASMAQRRLLVDLRAQRDQDHRESAMFVTMLMGLLIGTTVVAVWGFRAWYSNLQRYLDVQVRLEAEAAVRAKSMSPLVKKSEHAEDA